MKPALAPAPELIWFTGSDSVKFLNDLLSQEIGTLPSGNVVKSLLLQPQGKLDFVLWVLKGDGRVGLITEDGRGDELFKTLSRYRIRVDVEIEPETRESYMVVGDSEIEPGTWAETEEGLKANLSWSNLARELVVGHPRPDLADVDPDELTAKRIEAGVGLFGVDLDDKTIPQEAGVVPETISFNKGCFLGQELVARLDSRGGRVNRHLRVLEFGQPVEVGTSLVAGDREVGTVTTSAGDKGLALVWREVEPGDTVDAGGVEGVVREIPQKTA